MINSGFGTDAVPAADECRYKRHDGFSASKQRFAGSPEPSCSPKPACRRADMQMVVESAMHSESWKEIIRNVSASFELII